MAGRDWRQDGGSSPVRQGAIVIRMESSLVIGGIILAGLALMTSWRFGYWCGQRDEARRHVEMLRRKLPL